MEEESPHVVLLDLMLPGTDWSAPMEEVPEFADVPVIFVSGYGRDQVTDRALEARPRTTSSSHFADSNGRVTRALVHWHLVQHDYLPVA